MRTKAIVNEIVSLAGMSSTKIGAVGLPRKDFERIKNVHDEKVMSVSEDFWRYRRKRRQVKDVLVKLGARRVRDVMRIFIR